MPLVIETNVSFDKESGEIKDNQSRVIEVHNWNDYIEELHVHAPIHRESIYGDLPGVSIPVGYMCRQLYRNERSIAFICTIPGTEIWAYKMSYLVDDKKSFIKDDELVYCVGCQWFRLCDEGIPYCPHENECDLDDCSDGKPYAYRPYYELRGSDK